MTALAHGDLKLSENLDWSKMPVNWVLIIGEVDFRSADDEGQFLMLFGKERAFLSL